MITVHENARDQVRRLMAEEGCPEGSFVRVGVKGGGCSGPMYELTFDGPWDGTDGHRVNELWRAIHEEYSRMLRGIEGLAAVKQQEGRE